MSCGRPRCGRRRWRTAACTAFSRRPIVSPCARHTRWRGGRLSRAHRFSPARGSRRRRCETDAPRRGGTSRFRGPVPGGGRRAPAHAAQSGRYGESGGRRPPGLEHRVLRDRGGRCRPGGGRIRKIAVVVPGFSRSITDWCIPALRDHVDRLGGSGHEVHVFAIRWPHRRASNGVGPAQVHAFGGGQRLGVRVVSPWRRVIRAMTEEHRRGGHRAVHRAIRAGCRPLVGLLEPQ